MFLPIFVWVVNPILRRAETSCYPGTRLVVQRWDNVPPRFAIFHTVFGMENVVYEGNLDDFQDWEIAEFCYCLFLFDLVGKCRRITSFFDCREQT